MGQARRQLAETELLEKLADRALGHVHVESLSQDALEIDASPPHNPIDRKLGPVRDERGELCLLRRSQTRFATRRRAV